MPGANVRDEKDEKEDDAEAIEPASHPAPNHTLVMMMMTAILIWRLGNHPVIQPPITLG